MEFMVVWTAGAKCSGDTALIQMARQSGVALRFPPHSTAGENLPSHQMNKSPSKSFPEGITAPDCEGDAQCTR
jgi:hypothetical protein